MILQITVKSETNLIVLLTSSLNCQVSWDEFRIFVDIKSWFLFDLYLLFV